MRTAERMLSTCALALAVSPALAGTGQTGATCAYTMRLDVPSAQGAGGSNSAPKSVEVQGRAWQSGQKARIEMGMQGRMTRTVILTGNAVYSLRPDRNIAVKRPMTPQSAKKLYDGFPLILLHPVDPASHWQGATKTGAETVNGVPCDIWRVVLPGTGRQETSLWFPRSKAPAAPLKAVVAMSTPALVEGKVTASGPKLLCTVTASHLKQNVSVPASLFVVPRGYVVQGTPPAGARAHRSAALPRLPSRAGAGGAVSRR